MENKKYKKILITGADGFVGSTLAKMAVKEEFQTIFSIRRKKKINLPLNSEIYFKEVNGDTNWKDALKGVDGVVHLAARAHILKESNKNPLKEYLKVNSIGTKNLAEQCLEYGVKKFVYLSSIGVFGRASQKYSFNEESPIKPETDYAFSKLTAEHHLKDLENSKMDVVIIRPPLVYGPGVGGNFLRLLDLVSKGVPLPLGKINNKRSFISSKNLCSAILYCLKTEKSAGETFLVSDGKDLSTTELINKTAFLMKKKTKVFKVPDILIKTILIHSGKSNLYDSLFESLVIDSSKITEKTGWKPEISLDHGLKETVEWYQNI